MIDISPEVVAEVAQNLRDGEEGSALERIACMLSALRSSLSCCEEERRLGQEEVRTLRDTIKRLEGRACLLCGKDEPCMTEADLAPEDPGVPCTFDPSPIDAALKFFAERNEAREELRKLRAEVERLREDAERYRWMGSNCTPARAHLIFSRTTTHEIDAAIDAARKEGK